MGQYRIIVFGDPEEDSTDRTLKFMIQELLPFVGWSDAIEEVTTSESQIESELNDAFTALSG